MDKIKPCPFCGSEAELKCGTYYSIKWVECTGCYAESYAFDTTSEAIEAWNRRASDDT